jgi:hypothetical protein
MYYPDGVSPDSSFFIVTQGGYSTHQYGGFFMSRWISWRRRNNKKCWRRRRRIEHFSNSAFARRFERSTIPIILGEHTVINIATFLGDGRD